MRDVAFKITHRSSNLLLLSRRRYHWYPSLIRRSQSLRPKLWQLIVPGFYPRGVKTKTIQKLDELPQGLLEGEDSLKNDEDDGPSYPAVVQQAWNNMQKFRDCVILTRVGNFYEVRVWL